MTTSTKPTRRVCNLDCIDALLNAIEGAYISFANWFSDSVISALCTRFCGGRCAAAWGTLFPIVFSYAEMAADTILAGTLLRVTSPVFGLSYGVIGFAILGISILTELLVVKVGYPARWLSKDMLIALVALSPVSLAFGKATFPHDQSLPQTEEAAAIKRSILLFVLSIRGVEA